MHPDESAGGVSGQQSVLEDLQYVQCPRLVEGDVDDVGEATGEDLRGLTRDDAVDVCPADREREAGELSHVQSSVWALGDRGRHRVHGDLGAWRKTEERWRVDHAVREGGEHRAGLMGWDPRKVVGAGG